MKVLVTGATGMLGRDVADVLRQRGVDFLPTGSNVLDITDANAVLRVIGEYNPDAVIHCAAYTAVDRAEKEPEACMLVNGEGTRNISRVCRDINAKLLYVSTDYVFSGRGTRPYEVDDEPQPGSVYGKSKLCGEDALKELVRRYFIVRTSWAFGENGRNFVTSILEKGRRQDCVDVVCDQIGSPTYTRQLASLLCDIVATERYGVYHASNEGYCSFADWAREIFAQAGVCTRVNPVTSAEYPSAAKRPYNSRLSKRSLDHGGFHRLPDWKEAVTSYIQNLPGQNM